MLIKSRLYFATTEWKKKALTFCCLNHLYCINVCFPFKDRGRRFAIKNSFTQVKPRSRKSSFQLREWIRTGTPIPERHTVHAQCTTKRNDDLVCDRDATTLFNQSLIHSSATHSTPQSCPQYLTSHHWLPSLYYPFAPPRICGNCDRPFLIRRFLPWRVVTAVVEHRPR